MFLLLPRRNTCSIIHLIRPRFISASAANNPNFMVNYLITSFGFSPDKATKVSKTIARIKSPEKPDSVRNFLKHHGFTEAHIKSLITWHPPLLCCSPEKTLEPNLRALREMDLSTSALTQIILSNPRALQLRTAVPRIKFWKDFLGGSESLLVRAFKFNGGLASHDTSPQISHLQSFHGLTTNEIRSIVLRVPRFFTKSISSVEDMLKRAKELGFRPGAATFVSGLLAVSYNSTEALQKKMELLKSFGWSEDELTSSLRRSPTIVTLSETNLQMKMDFLMGEFKCSSSYIVANSELLTYSLEKRLRPRHHIMCVLESRGLCSKGWSLYNAIHMTDKKFTERYILPHKEEISGLHEAYLTAAALQLSSVL